MNEVERPWGKFTILDEDSGYKVKRIEVAPGHRLSYQRHAQRKEHWMIVHGNAVVTLDGHTRSLSMGETVDVPIGAAHRLANPHDEILIVIEIQRGKHLDDDDIERLEDDYGRTLPR